MDIRDGLLMRKNEKPVSVSKGTAAEGHMDAFKLEDSAVIAGGRSACHGIAVEGHIYAFALDDSLGSQSVNTLIALLSKTARTHLRLGTQQSLPESRSVSMLIALLSKATPHTYASKGEEPAVDTRVDQITRHQLLR
jgi:hypothetical protein